MLILSAFHLLKAKNGYLQMINDFERIRCQVGNLKNLS